MAKSKIFNSLRKHLFSLTFIGLIVFSVTVFYYDLKNYNNQSYFAFSVNNEEYPYQDERIDAVVKEIDANSGEAIIDVTLTEPKRNVGPENQDDTIMTLISPREKELSATNQTSRPGTYGFMDLVNYEDVTNRLTYSTKDLRVFLNWNGLPFPFDAYDFDVSFQPYTAYNKDSTIRIGNLVPTLTVLMDDKNFVYSTNQTKLDLGEGAYINFPDPTAHIKIKRPFYIQLQVTAIIALLLFIVGWTSYRINQVSVTTDTPIEILALNIGIILAIPSVRDAIVPEGLKKIPLIDFGVNLIIMLSMVSLATYLVKLYWKNKGSTEKRR